MAFQPKLRTCLDTIKENEKVVFLNTSDIYLGKVLKHDFEDASSLPGQAKKRIKKGDLLFSEIRPANGRFAEVDFNAQKYVVSTKLMVLRCRKGIDNHFFRLFLTSREQLENLQTIAEDRSGTFPQITFDHIANLDILLPPLPEQRAIAAVLSSLDDKIDLLRRQNKTIEALAETLFRKMFIEDAPQPSPRPSPKGREGGEEEADEGWEEVPLSFFGKIICGKTPSKKNNNYFGGIIPFIKIPDMHKKIFVFDTLDSLTEEGKQSQENKTLPPKSICVSCIATVGLVSINAIECQTNQQINSIIPKKKNYRYFLFLKMKSLFEYLQAMASGGTATLNLNTGDFSNILIDYPGDEYLDTFNSYVEPFFKRIFLNQKQIRTLEKLRDTLLPKLMSGEVRVEADP